MRSQIEGLEFESREQATPLPSFLAEHRDSVQHLWRSARAQSTSLPLPSLRRHQKQQQRALAALWALVLPPALQTAYAWAQPSHLSIASESEDNEEGASQAPHGLASLALCSVDLLGLLVALMHWKAVIQEPLTVEQFDELVPYLLVAHGLQSVLGTRETQAAFAPPHSDHPDVGPTHEGLAFLLERVLSPEEKRRGQSLGVSLRTPPVQQRQFVFLRQLYILRHTLFDVFFSELPDGSGSAPFLEVSNILLNPCPWFAEESGGLVGTGLLPGLEPTPLSWETLLPYWRGGEGKQGQVVRPVERFCPWRFVPLPPTYCFPYAEPYASQAVCSVCHTRSEMPLLCLHCGTLLPQCTQPSCSCRPPHEELFEVLSLSLLSSIRIIIIVYSYLSLSLLMN